MPSLKPSRLELLWEDEWGENPHDPKVYDIPDGFGVLTPQAPLAEDEIDFRPWLREMTKLVRDRRRQYNRHSLDKVGMSFRGRIGNWWRVTVDASGGWSQWGFLHAYTGEIGVSDCLYGPVHGTGKHLSIQTLISPPGNRCFTARGYLRDGA